MQNKCKINAKYYWCLTMFDDVWRCLMMFDDVWYCLMNVKTTLRALYYLLLFILVSALLEWCLSDAWVMLEWCLSDSWVMQNEWCARKEGICKRADLFGQFYLPALGIDPWPLRQQSERVTTTPAMSNNHPMYEMELKWSQMEINGDKCKINAK